MVQRLNTSDTIATVKGVAVIKLSRTIMKENYNRAMNVRNKTIASAAKTSACMCSNETY